MRSEVRKYASIPIALLGVWLGVRYLMPIVMPFLLGAAMAMAAEPGVRFLVRRVHLPRGAAAGVGVSGVFLGLCVLITLLLSLLFRELGLLTGILPEMERTVMDGLDALRDWLLGLSLRASPGIRNLIQRNVNDAFSGGAAMLDQATRYALGLAGNLLSHLPGSALGAGTAVLSAFLISAELPRIRVWSRKRIPTRRLDAAIDVWHRFRSAAGLWLLAQLKLTGLTCLLLVMGLLLLRIPHAPMWAAAISLLDALPVLGTGSVLLPWSVVLLLRHDGARALGLLGLYLTAALTRSALEPRLIGRQLGLDPLVTLIALYTGFRLWGLPGMILTPLLAITVIHLQGAEE